ncbi:MAG: hypothetical protein R3B90_21700 [Planctomycetaceae bacterium]
MQLIGETGNPDEPAEGAEIFEPFQEFSETHYVPSENVTEAYKVSLGALVGKLNSGTFRARAARTVLAKSVSGSLRSLYADWEITYRFAFKPHQTGLNVGGTWNPETETWVGGVTYDREGWQHVWPLTKSVEQYGKIIRDVRFLCVADLYESADFGGFGI